MITIINIISTITNIIITYFTRYAVQGMQQLSCLEAFSSDLHAGSSVLSPLPVSWCFLSYCLTSLPSFLDHFCLQQPGQLWCPNYIFLKPGRFFRFLFSFLFYLAYVQISFLLSFTDFTLRSFSLSCSKGFVCSVFLRMIKFNCFF